MVTPGEADLRSACDADGTRRDAWPSGRGGQRAGRYHAGRDDRQPGGRGRGPPVTGPTHRVARPRRVPVRGAAAPTPGGGPGRGARVVPRDAEPAVPAALS